jgi:hypothetical protein
MRLIIFAPYNVCIWFLLQNTIQTNEGISLVPLRRANISQLAEGTYLQQEERYEPKE